MENDRDQADNGNKHYPIADSETSKKINQTVVNKTGFDPVELLEAPAKPPELKNARRSFSLLQFSLIMGGSVIAVIGLIIWTLLELGGVGIVLMVIGAVCVVVGALVRV